MNIRERVDGIKRRIAEGEGQDASKLKQSEGEKKAKSTYQEEIQKFRRLFAKEKEHFWED